MKRSLLIYILMIFISDGCSTQVKTPPTLIPSGILIQEISTEMDIIFDSIRYVLNDPVCLDEHYQVDKNFINLPLCNALIYDPVGDGLASPRQLFAMDIETGGVIQLTNTECSFALGQAVNQSTIMTLASCSDTDNNGFINEKDNNDLFFLDLKNGDMNCLTCEKNLRGINNPDYSTTNEQIVFSAQYSDEFHNYLFRIDGEKNLAQITDQAEFMDFDCSWSEDGNKIVFSRLPAPWFSSPSQVWIMDADGSNLEHITSGGLDPNNEGSHGPYPIGIDADPDLSPNGKKIVFSRLKTGKENIPFGIYQLVVVDVVSKEIKILDASYANMIPQWKSKGILINRQVGTNDSGKLQAMKIKQSLHVYQDSIFKELEIYPYNIFPIGAYGGYWIELE